MKLTKELKMSAFVSQHSRDSVVYTNYIMPFVFQIGQQEMPTISHFRKKCHNEVKIN